MEYKPARCLFLIFTILERIVYRYRNITSNESLALKLIDHVFLYEDEALF